MGCSSSRIRACCGAGGVKGAPQVDESSALPLPYETSKEDGGVTEGVAGVLFGGGEARHEEGHPQDEQGPKEEDSTPAAKSGSDSSNSSPKDKVAKEAAAESTSEQGDGGFAVRIAGKLGLMPTEEKEDETAAAAADVDAGPTEETPAAAREDSTPAAKSDSDSSDSSSDQSDQDKDKDHDKNDGGFLGMIAEKLGLAPSEEEGTETAAAPAANVDAGATT